MCVTVTGVSIALLLFAVMLFRACLDCIDVCSLCDTWNIIVYRCLLGFSSVHSY